jgi:hypothetical protein
VEPLAEFRISDGAGDVLMGAGKGYEYRQHAQECLRLADEMGSPEHRALLFDMARAWHQLAQDYERIEWPETVTIDC